MAALSKNDVLDDIVNKYSNTFHRTIKLKPIDVKSDSYAECNFDSNEKKFLNLKLVIMQEFQNIKTFMLKDLFQIGQKRFLLLAK